MVLKQCENVRAGRSKVYSKETKTSFIFKGLIKCKNCGCVVTPEIKKGKYVYLRSNPKDGCNCKQISEEKALKFVSEVLQRMLIPENLAKELKNTLKNSLEAKKTFNTDSIKMLRSQETKVKNNLDRLLQIHIDRSITKDEYDKKANEFRSELHNIRTKISKHADADEDFAITVEYLLDIASRTYELFKSSGIDKKRRILNLVFPNFFLNGAKLEYTIRRPFDILTKKSSYTIALGLMDGIRTFYEENQAEFKLLLSMLRQLIA